MNFNPNKPYNELPKLPPKKDLETKNILKQTISAAGALSELKGATGRILNPDVLINTVVLQEPKSSSAIENIITTNDRLFKALAAKSRGTDPSAKEVLRYREALWAGYNELNKRNVLSTNLFVKIFQSIKDTDAGIRKTPGTKLINSKDEVIYTPPEGENIIRDLLSNLET